MKKIFSSFVLLQISMLFMAQTGSLRVDFYIDSGEAFLYRQDSLVEYYAICPESAMWYLDDLEIGEYSLKVEYPIDTVKCTQVIEQIKIHEDDNFEISIYMIDFQNTNAPKEEETSEKPIFSFYYTNGSGFINPNDTLFKSLYEFGFDYGALYPIMNHFSVGFQLGVANEYSYFQKNKHMFYPEDFKSEKYNYWKYKASLMARLSGYDITKTSNSGAFLDVGVSYNFPMRFRYIYKNKNTSTITKKLHQFTDFSARMNLGYDNLSLQVDYRLTNYIKDFPEIPKLKVGIAITFEE